ncbi:MAG: sugar transferase [Lachnospiraceae bacterium]|nr:sugar transferase [Lachnospiraceae bacterium]
MYKKKRKGWTKHIDFTIMDLLCLMSALIIAYYIRFDGAWIFGKFENDRWRTLFVTMILIDLVAVFFLESYKNILRRTKYQELRATVFHCSVVFGGMLVYLYATKKSFEYSRATLFTFFFIAIVLEYFGRVTLKRIVRRRLILDKNKAVMIVVAESDNVERCLSEIAHNIYTDFKVVGVAVVDKDFTGNYIQGIPVIATADTFMEYVRTHVVDEVFIDGNTKASSEALGHELVEFGITVHISLVHTDKLLPNRAMENYANYVVMTSSMHIASARQLFVKRVMDIFGSIIGLIFTGIAFIIFAPIIKIQSPGPVFYKSVRIGQNGRRFRFYKFRSMYVDADKELERLKVENEMQGNMFKMEDDPRIIPIGHFMRKHSIDELPQFWNVFKGDMSLVGTRPPTEEEFEQYEYHHKARLGFKPGLTGMWQVSGRSDIRDFEEVVAIDTQYIADWTIGLDIMIIFKTIGVVLTGKGSK